MPARKQTEKQFMDAARMAVQELGARLFRNNNGVAKFVHKGKETTVRYGLGTGTHDLIGWTSVVVTPEMVGRKVAVFTALEGKKNDRDKMTDEQLDFLRAVMIAGGISFEFRSADQAETRLKQEVFMIRGGK